MTTIPFAPTLPFDPLGTDIALTEEGDLRQALLYADESMLNRPLYVSAPTGPDGTFQLSFPVGGAYYLAARNSLGGTPAPGELYGRYQGVNGPILKLETGGILTGVTVTVNSTPDAVAPGRGWEPAQRAGLRSSVSRKNPPCRLEPDRLRAGGQQCPGAKT